MNCNNLVTSPPIPKTAARGRFQKRWLFVFAIFPMAIAFVGIRTCNARLENTALFKPELTLREISESTGVELPDCATLDRFKWYDYYYVDFWRAVISFPVGEAESIAASVRETVDDLAPGRDSKEDRDDNASIKDPRLRGFVQQKSDNWLGCWKWRSDHRLSVNAWMTTNGPLGTLVLSCTL